MNENMCGILCREQSVAAQRCACYMYYYANLQDLFSGVKSVMYLLKIMPLFHNYVCYVFQVGTFEESINILEEPMPVASVDPDETVDMDNCQEPLDIDDFEVEVPPLALFPRTKDEDSEDSDEFEVPDQPEMKENSFQENLTNTATKHPPKLEKSKITDNNQYDINLSSMISEQTIDPDLLTPRDKTVSDLLNVGLTDNVNSNGREFISSEELPQNSHRTSKNDPDTANVSPSSCEETKSEYIGVFDILCYLFC